MWRLQNLLHGTDETKDALHQPQPPKKSALREALGTFAYNKLPEHEKVRFESALGVQSRIKTHAGNAIVYDEYEHHLDMQMQAKQEVEGHQEQRYNEFHQKRLMSQASIVRRVDNACKDDHAWKRSQMRASMLRSNPNGTSVFAKGVSFRGMPGGNGHGDDDDDDDDWLGQHHAAQVEQSKTGNGRQSIKVPKQGSMARLWLGGTGNRSQHVSQKISNAPEEQSWVAKTKDALSNVIGKISNSGAASPSPTGKNRPFVSFLSNRKREEAQAEEPSEEATQVEAFQPDLDVTAALKEDVAQAPDTHAMSTRRRRRRPVQRSRTSPTLVQHRTPDPRSALQPDLDDFSDEDMALPISPLQQLRAASTLPMSSDGRADASMVARAATSMGFSRINETSKPSPLATPSQGRPAAQTQHVDAWLVKADPGIPDGDHSIRTKFTEGLKLPTLSSPKT